MEPMRRHIGTQFAHRPRLAIVGGIFDHFQLQTRWMVEPDELLPKPFLDSAVLHLVMRQVLIPKLGGALLHRIRSGLDLARSRTARYALVREGGVNRTRLRVGVRIIQVVVGVPSVKKNGLFNQPLPKDLRHEIYVFLGSRCTNSDVVETRYQGHVAVTSGAIISSAMRVRAWSQYINPVACMQGLETDAELALCCFGAARFRQRTGPDCARPSCAEAQLAEIVNQRDDRDHQHQRGKHNGPGTV